jgi:hypothetical protein
VNKKKVLISMATNFLKIHSTSVVDGYDVLVALLESELGQILANCRAIGIGGSNVSSSSPLDNINLLLSRSKENKRTALDAAAKFINRHDNA